MKKNDNESKQKTYFIYIRSTGEKVPVTKAQHDSFYREASRIRNKEQNHGRCMCPYRYIWKCDGDCIGCEYHAAGDISSLDQPLPDGLRDRMHAVGGTFGRYCGTGNAEVAGCDRTDVEYGGEQSGRFRF